MDYAAGMDEADISSDGRERRAAHWMRRAAQSALDVVLPPLCLACSSPIGSRGALCPRCWGGLDLISRPFCERLGTPFDADLGLNLISPRAIADPPDFSRARGAVRFDGTGRLLVHRLKYGDRMDLSAAMAGWMARAGAEVLAEADFLVPVPLHRTRLWKRRFNQAAELAKGVSRLWGVPVDHDILVRRKRTRSQVGLSRAQRARNLSGALAVPEAMRGRVAGRRVVLIDDVLTTGSTLNAAARILRRAGAADVDALVFALVVDPG
ncbi:ComF family protein [Terrihabitans sp. B22-R8]|uniref:ComF family protein n=1 Tax=Terrihabitans sp. B22-R8 TaxID=3425128 RepID=UPI00403C3228